MRTHALLQSEHDVRSRHFVAISRAQHQEVWNRAEARERLDRLVGWSVLAKPDRVVGKNEQHSEVRERAHTHCTKGIPSKDDKCRRKRNEPAVPVRRGARRCEQMASVHKFSSIQGTGRDEIIVNKSYAAMPFAIAHMPCSRTPNRRYRPDRSTFE